MSVRAVNPVVIEKLDPWHKLRRRFILNGTKTNNKLKRILVFRHLLGPRNFVYGLLIVFATGCTVSSLPTFP